MQLFYAATFGHQPQPAFSSQTPAVVPYPAPTPALGPTAGPPPYPAPALGPTAGPPPYPAGSIAPPPYPGPPAPPLGFVDTS